MLAKNGTSHSILVCCNKVFKVALLLKGSKNSGLNSDCNVFLLIDFEAAEKVRMAQELSEFDSQLSDEEKKEKERNAKRLAALNKRKEEMVKEKQQKHKVRLEKTKCESSVSIMHFCTCCLTGEKLPNRPVLTCHFCLLHRPPSAQSGEVSLDYIWNMGQFWNRLRFSITFHVKVKKDFSKNYRFHFRNSKIRYICFDMQY